MIETIYNVENDETRNMDMSGDGTGKKPNINIRLPKNIRQIGQSDVTMNYQIYIEENVLAYIKRTPRENEKICYGVLIGDKKQGNGYTYVFVNGLIEIDDILEKTIIFSDDVWTGVYDNLKRYYKNSYIVGWYASTESDISKDMHSIRKIHLDHFAGNGKVFLNINREESEEAFYVYERNGLRKQPCYHVYFEKSVEFEDYIFGTGKEERHEIKQGNVSEKGKYGIAINNLKNSQQNKTEKIAESEGDAEQKLPDISKLKKVASFVTILALAGVLGFMGKEGQLGALKNRMSNMVGSIIDKKEKSSVDIISVNGELSGKETVGVVNGEPQTTDYETGDELQTTDYETGELAVTTDVTDNEMHSTPAVSDNSEEQTTVKEATVSLPNENYEAYIVKAGDTLYSISMKKYGNPNKIKEIVELNKLKDENYVREGQKILLP